MKPSKVLAYSVIASLYSLAIIGTVSLGVFTIVKIFENTTGENNPDDVAMVGETYIYTFGEENPFEPPYVKYHRVLDVKNGYVLYLDSVTGDTNSMTMRSFMIDSEKLTKKKDINRK